MKKINVDYNNSLVSVSNSFIKYYGKKTFHNSLDILDKEFINNILENDYAKLPSYKRIIVKYFNNIDLCEDDLDHLECIELESNKDTFYLLLLIIFCLDFYIKKLLS